MKKINNKQDMIINNFYFLVNGKPWDGKKLPLQTDVIEPYLGKTKLKVIKFRANNTRKDFIQEKVYGHSLARMLYIYFIDDIPENSWVVHKDGNVYNNDLANLTLANNKYATDKKIWLERERCKNAKIQRCSSQEADSGLKEV